MSSAISLRGLDPSAIAAVTSSECGAPANVFGEKTNTKLIAKFRQLTFRRFAISALMFRPRTFTVSAIPDMQPQAGCDLASSETSGGPL